ncbi:MAG: tRNA (adenosine(37)-N6)-dimethylallyltransferase MiaA [Bacteroidales bacterium]|jgi:tRNA dimethylallyltransferase
MLSHIPLITVLGPTAVGKTKLAVGIAHYFKTEIISADSRQVYRGMDIGTGKDIDDYNYCGEKIPVHLIDIVDAGEKYDIYNYKNDFIVAYNTIKSKNKTPILCGGSGLYLNTVLLDYNLPQADFSKENIDKYAAFSDEELIAELKSLKELHNTTDTEDRDRLIKALIIAKAENNSDNSEKPQKLYPSPVIGITDKRENIINNIDLRLEKRLEEGMIEEVESLIDSGIEPDDLKYYGLEYKFITSYLLNEIDFDTMKNNLKIAIHQFSKRQMTWYRNMQKKGIEIFWLNLSDGLNVNTQKAVDYIIKLEVRS